MRVLPTLMQHETEHMRPSAISTAIKRNLHANTFAASRALCASSTAVSKPKHLSICRAETTSRSGMSQRQSAMVVIAIGQPVENSPDNRQTDCL